MTTSTAILFHRDLEGLVDPWGTSHRRSFGMAAMGPRLPLGIDRALPTTERNDYGTCLDVQCHGGDHYVWREGCARARCGGPLSAAPNLGVGGTGSDRPTGRWCRLAGAQAADRR